MQFESFTTERLSPAHSLQAWNATTSHGFLVKPRGTAPFRGSLRRYASQRYKFTEITVSSHTGICRPAASIAATRSKPYLLVLLNEGTAHVLQDGREAFVKAGDGVLVDVSRPLCIEATELQACMIDIPVVYLREFLPQVDGLTAICVPGQKPAGTILKAAFNQLSTFTAKADDEVFDHVSDAILHLLAASLVALTAAKNTIPRQSEAFHRHRVLEFVRIRLDDRNLSPQMIAHSLDLPLRQIYQLFANQPFTLMRYIWNERLDRCRDELAMTWLTHRSVSEIGYRWGFSDPAHFSRAFKNRFGQSPLTFRRNESPMSRRKALAVAASQPLCAAMP